VLSLPFVGALVASRRPRHSIGWLLVATGFCLGALLLAQEYAWYGLVDRPDALPAAGYVLWSTDLFFRLALGIGLMTFFLFPTGKPPSPKWWPVLALVIVGFVCNWLSVAFRSGQVSPSYPVFVENPLGSTTLDGVFAPLSGPAKLLTYLSFPAAAAALFSRFRSAGEVQHQQLKWLLYPAALMAISFVAAIVGEQFGLAAVAVNTLVAIAVLGFGLIPVAVGAATIRYRLYDIDFIINRTIVYGAVLIALLAAFMIGSTLAQHILESLTGGRSDLLTLAVASVVALGFQPLRQRAKSLADRLLPARQELALMFTDIVGSTERLAAVGDAVWRKMLEEYRATVRRALRQYGGSEMHIAGDSFFATFNDPSRAVRCALHLAQALRELGVPSRFGLHSGVCEMRGEEVSGIAVWTAARVMAEAGAGEVLVSDAFRAALEGHRVDIEDRGVHVLKGIPGEWRLHAITSG
jgi:class 3 adenylate cyclase